MAFIINFVNGQANSWLIYLYLYIFIAKEQFVYNQMKKLAWFSL